MQTHVLPPLPAGPQPQPNPPHPSITTAARLLQVRLHEPLPSSALLDGLHPPPPSFTVLPPPDSFKRLHLFKGAKPVASSALPQYLTCRLRVPCESGATKQPGAPFLKPLPRQPPQLMRRPQLRTENPLTRNPRPQTPNTQTPDPKPQTQNAKTPSSKPKSQNPKPKTQNPKPKTPNPKPKT